MHWMIRAIRALLVAFYLELPRHREGQLVVEIKQERLQEKRKQKRQIRKQKKEKPKHEWKRNRVKKLPQNRNYLKTKSKDKRYSDHQKLRRMYRKY